MIAEGRTKEARTGKSIAIRAGIVGLLALAAGGGVASGSIQFKHFTADNYRAEIDQIGLCARAVDLESLDGKSKRITKPSDLPPVVEQNCEIDKIITFDANGAKRSNNGSELGILTRNDANSVIVSFPSTQNSAELQEITRQYIPGNDQLGSALLSGALAAILAAGMTAPLAFKRY